MVSAASFFRRAVPCLLALASTVVADVWPNDIRVPGYVIGGKEGSDFTLLGNAGTMVSLLRVYRSNDDRKIIRGLHVEYSDGKTQEAGRMEDDYQEIRFKEGEKITTMTLWGDGRGTRSGRITFETDQGQKFAQGKDNVGGQDSFAMNVGSGNLLGFFGRAGADINAMSPIFMKPVKSLFVDNVKYPSLDATKGLTLKTIKQSESTWSGSPYEMEFSGWEETSETTDWKFDFTTSLTAGVEFEASIPLITKGKVSVSWMVGITSSHGGSKSETSKLQWKITTPIKTAADAVRCTAQYWAGDAQIDWTGTMHLTLKDDESKKFTYPTGGSLKRVSSSQVMASCEPINKSKRAVAFIG